jgi:hydrogenase maturation protease
VAEPRRRTASALFAAPGGDLVIGIGNSLRSDDGVGWRLARRAEHWRPEAQVRSVQQLTPELAVELAAASRVLFIDAWLRPEASGWHCKAEEEARRHRPVAVEMPGNGAASAAAGSRTHRASAAPEPWSGASAPEPATPLLRRLRVAGPEAEGSSAALAPFSHQMTPETLLRIAQLLQGHRPEAWQLLVPAFDLAHGEGCSNRQKALLPRAETLLRQWLQGRNAAAGASRA